MLEDMMFLKEYSVFINISFVAQIKWNVYSINIKKVISTLQNKMNRMFQNSYRNLIYKNIIMLWIECFKMSIDISSIKIL